MDDEYEWSDARCPKCQHSPTHMRTCTSLGCDDGCFDEYEDDPINALPGEFSICAECGGTGIEHWCPKCGHDMNTTANAKIHGAAKPSPVE